MDAMPSEPARLFRTGQFDEAENACKCVLSKARKDFPATLLKGRLALLGNRLNEAHKWLTKARQLSPEDEEAHYLLAEVAYRRDDFQWAAALYRTVGADLKAARLESFKGQIPNQIISSVQKTVLPFIQTDPLPLIAAKINGGEEVNFIIDTGGAEVILDTEFARQSKGQIFGQGEGKFAGGKRAPVELGRIDSLSLGGMEVKNVPVTILSTRTFSFAAQGKPVCGFIGTVFLYHFLSTLDYPGGALILQRRSPANLRRLEQQAKAEGYVIVPFWMAGDHFMVAWGQVNHSHPLLFFVDTGLAGGGFLCPESTVEEAGIKLPEGKEFEGVGGGGKIKSVPFLVDELSLGQAKQQNITGVAGAFPTSLEFSQGFRIGGIISHQFFRPYALTFDFTGMHLFLK